VVENRENANNEDWQAFDRQSRDKEHVAEGGMKMMVKK